MTDKNTNNNSITKCIKILLVIIMAFVYIKIVIADLTCSISTSSSCSGGDITLLRMQNSTGGYENAHAQLANYSASLYNNTLCCSSSNNPSLNNTCGTSFLRLSNQTNAHVQNSSNTTYNFPACIYSTTTSTCGTYLNNCPSNYNCLLSIASDLGNNATNAHVGSCNKYSLKVCCSINSQPSFSLNPIINSTEGNNLTTRNLNIVFKSTENDAGDTLSYSIQVYTNNKTNFTLTNIAYTNGTLALQTIQYKNFTKGQSWKVMISVSDGSETIYANTSELLILNTPPAFQVAPVINSTNGLNTTEQNLNAYFTANESDVNDNLNYSVQVFKNNVTNFTLYGIAITNGTFTNFMINNANTTRGETWKAQVWINDGSANSTLMNTTELLILDNKTTIATITEPDNSSYKNSPVTFRWTNGTDLDNDLIMHILWVANNSAFTQTTTFTTLYTNSTTQTLGDGTYYWKVIEYDGEQNSTDSSTFTFTVDNILPITTFSDQTEANNTYKNQNFVFFNWTITESNFANVTISLFNRTNLILQSKNSTRILQINVTGVNTNDIYMYNATVRDLANNINTSETRTITLDNTLPVPIYVDPTSSNNTLIRQNWIFVNVTYTETNFANITFRLFNETAQVNVTISNSSNIIKQINFTDLANRNNIKYTYNVTVKDLANNQNTTETRTIALDNNLPSIPVLATPGNGSWQLFDNATLFDWQDSADVENSTLNYEFQLSNSTVFNNTYFIKNINLTQSNYTLAVNEMPPVGRYYYRARAFDEINYTNYSSMFQFDIVYAVINITSPSYDSSVRILSTYQFKVEEIANQNWVQNVNITFVNGGTTGPVVMTNNSNPITNYTYNLTIPNTASSYLTVTAIGYNGSLSVNSTSRFKITTPATVQITQPLITEIYSENTNTYPNVSANMTVRTDLSVILNGINVNIVQPNRSKRSLVPTENNEANYINNSYNYEHNYTFTPVEIGEHIIEVSVTDANYPDSNYVAYKNNSFYVNNTISISLTISGTGFDNITLNDIYSKRQLHKSNASLVTDLIPGRYDTKTSTSKIDTVLVNATIDASVSNLCAFEDVSETIAVPTNSRAVDQFNMDCGNVTFTHANMTYNYTNLISSITYEDNLKFYKCGSASSCTWVLLNKTLITDQNKITANFNNFSVFMLSEDTTPSTTATTTVSGGAGGGGGGELSKLIAIDIIRPGDLSVYTDDSIITPLIIKNTGKTSLFGIALEATTFQKGLELIFDNNYIDALTVGEQRTTSLRIISRNFTDDQAEVVVTAKVVSPAIQDQVKFLIRSLRGISEEEANAKEQVTFLNQFFNGNPECLELKELLIQAEEALKNKQYAKATSLSDAAIQSCKNLLSLQGREPKMPKKPMEISDILIVGIEALIFLVIIYSLYNYYKKRRLKKHRK